jgi:uncharacterized protein (DUF924 family)
MPSVTPSQVVAFWVEAGSAAWYKKSDAFDRAIQARFGDAHYEAARGELENWEASAEGALALLLLLDQFPRNMFRDSPHAFATDGLALAIARRAIENGHDEAFEMPVRQFFYLPFMHAENLDAQEECVQLCEAHTSPENVRFAVIHRDIIAQFGRFPHRNALFGRETTAAEQAFLEGGGFKG